MTAPARAIDCGTPPAVGSAGSRAPAEPAASPNSLKLIVEFFVVATAGIDGSPGPLRGGRRTLQELRRVMRRLAAIVTRSTRVAGRALGRITADLALQRDDVGKDVGLAA